MLSLPSFSSSTLVEAPPPAEVELWSVDDIYVGLFVGALEGLRVAIVVVTEEVSTVTATPRSDAAVVEKSEPISVDEIAEAYAVADEYPLAARDDTTSNVTSHEYVVDSRLRRRLDDDEITRL